MGRDIRALGFQILANTKALLGYWDKNVVCRFANQAYKEWLGINPEDIVDKATLREFLGPLYDKHLPMIKSVLLGDPQVFERDFVLPEGGIRRAVVSYTPDIVGNSVEGFYIHAADVSTSINTEKQFFKHRDHALETVKTLQMNLLSRFPGLEQLARNEGVSQSKLKRDFKNRTGSNPFTYYRKLQMDFAHSYLKENRCSRKQMAVLLNFSNPSNFSACYNNYLKDRERHRPIENAARASEERYRIFIEQAPFALIMLDQDLRVLAVSQKWIESDPLKQKDVFGKKVFDLYQDVNPKWHSLVQEAMNGRHLFSNQDYLLSRNTMKYFKWDFSPWYNSSNEIGGAIIYMEDLGEITEFNDNSSKSKAILEEASKIAGIGVWEYNYTTQEEFWTDIAKEILEINIENSFSLTTLKAFCISTSDKEAISELIQNYNSDAISQNLILEVELRSKMRKTIRFVAVRNAYSERIAGIIQQVFTN
jgi:PAS domain S-box-containing protein